jgi:hypothetical protein
VNDLANDLENSTAYSLYHLDEMIAHAQGDETLLRVLYDQQETLGQLKQNNARFQDKFSDSVRKYRQDLFDREETCLRNDDDPDESSGTKY